MVRCKLDSDDEIRKLMDKVVNLATVGEMSRGTNLLQSHGVAEAARALPT